MLVIPAFQVLLLMLFVTRGDALRARPWLLYSAPLALGSFPGFYIPRLWRSVLSLAFIFRAFGARFLPLAFIFRAFGARFQTFETKPPKLP